MKQKIIFIVRTGLMVAVFVLVLIGIGYAIFQYPLVSQIGAFALSLVIIALHVVLGRDGFVSLLRKIKLVG